MNLNDRIRKALRAEASQLPDPSTSGFISPTPHQRRWTLAAITAAAVATVIGGFAWLGPSDTVDDASPRPPDTTSTTAIAAPASSCSQQVGVFPPASIQLVGDVSIDVPYRSWGCPGYDTDSFIDPSDFQISTSSGLVEMIVENATEGSVSAWASSAATEENVELEMSTTGPNTIQLKIPDGEIVLSVRVQTEDGRIAWYEATMTSQRITGYVPTAEETWLLDALGSAGFEADVAEANQTGNTAEVYIDINEHVQVFVASRSIDSPGTWTETETLHRVHLECRTGHEVMVETESSWNWAIHVALALEADLGCSRESTIGVWPHGSLSELVDARLAGTPVAEQETIATEFIREVLGWSDTPELVDVLDGTDRMAFTYEVGARGVDIRTETVFVVDTPIALVTYVSTVADLGDAFHLSASVTPDGEIWTARISASSAAELTAAGRPEIAVVDVRLRYGEHVYFSAGEQAVFTLEGPPIVPAILTVEYRDAAGRTIDFHATQIPPGPFAAG